MFDIAYEVEASILVAEKGSLSHIPRYDWLAAFYVEKCICAFRYWSIMYYTHGV